MNEPTLDLSEIVGLYKEDARRSVDQMRAAIARWQEVGDGGPACQQLRKLSHQLRGSGRTYGFSDVSRVGKAMELLIICLQAKRLPADQRLQQVLARYVERLGT